MAPATDKVGRRRMKKAGKGNSRLGQELSEGFVVPVDMDKLPPASNPAPAAPSHEEIAKRAYEIYRGRGGGEGRDQEDWFRAERELRGIATREKR